MAYKEDVYFSATQAIKVGFADEIFNGDWDSLKTYTEEQLLID